MSIRLAKIAGIRSENHANWTVYGLDDLLSQQLGHIFPADTGSDTSYGHIYTISASKSEWLKYPETRIVITEHDGGGHGLAWYHCITFDYADNKDGGQLKLREVSATISLPGYETQLSPYVPTSMRAMVTTYIDDSPDERKDFNILLVLFGPEPSYAITLLENLDNRWAFAYEADRIYMDSHGAMLVGLLENEIHIKRFDNV